MKTREELLYRVPMDEIKPWPGFRRTFVAIIFSGLGLVSSGMLSMAFLDQLPRLAPYLAFYGRVALPAGFLLIGGGIPWWVHRLHCPRCGHRLDVKQRTTDAKGVVLPCGSCRIGWSTGVKRIED